MKQDSFTKADAHAPAPKQTDASDFDTMTPAELLQELLAAVGPDASEKQFEKHSKAEVREVEAQGHAYANAERLNTGLPEGDVETHPGHWIALHRGLTGRSVHQYQFLCSNIYNVLATDPTTGKHYTYVLAAGLNWIPTNVFSGSFADDPRTKEIDKAVKAGIIDLYAPGQRLDPRALSDELKQKMAEGCMQLCTDPRTMRYFAGLAAPSATSEHLIKKAAQIESNGGIGPAGFDAVSVQAH